MNLDLFYTILKSAVRFSTSLQTFAVLNSISDLNSPNLGKVIQDFGKPYFFSRKWEKSGYNASEIRFTYPGLFVIETGKRYSFSDTYTTKVEVNLEMCVVDQWKDGLIIQEIERDTSKMLQSVISYIISVEAFNLDGELYYLHPDYIKYLKQQVSVGDVSKLFNETNEYHHAIKSMFASSKGFSLGLGSDMLYGSFIQTTITEYTDCTDEEFNWYVFDGVLKDLYCECR